MSIPDYQALMLPLLKLAGQGEVALQEAVRHLVEEFNLTPEEAGQRLASGQAVIYNRTGWAKTELVKAGLIEQPRRGLFCITDRGRELLANAPAAITRGFLIERYPEFRAYIEASSQQRIAAVKASAAAPSAAFPPTLPKRRTSKSTRPQRHSQPRSKRTY
jgi:restriction system protein